MNIQLTLHNKILLVRNLMKRMYYNEKHQTFRLEGNLTQDEKNAIHTALTFMQDKLNDLKVTDGDQRTQGKME